MNQIQTILSALLVVLVDKGDFIQIEKDSPPEKVIRLEDVVQVIEDFKEEYQGEE